MTYNPINDQVYFAAYSGALAGMAVSDRVPSDSSAANQANVAAIAGAFAQSFDTEWNSATFITDIQNRCIEQSSQSVWQMRAPQAGQVTPLVPATYSATCRALIAIITAGGTYVTGQGITIPDMGGVLVEDESVPLGFNQTIDFVGAGVTASALNGTVTVTIPGGGVGGTVDVETDAAPIGTFGTLNFKDGLAAVANAGTADITGTLSGDVTGLLDTSVVAKINGSTVPAGGALTNGNVLQVIGAAALAFAAVNLGGGANFVTGVLPAANQAAQTMAGDVTGTTAASVVEKINGATVPAAGALTTGNVLQVTGVGALSYGAVNLAGGANFVTGVLPAANQAAQTMAGDVTGTTAANTVVTITGSANVATIVNTTALVHGTTPATAGNFRIKNNYTIQGRNAANSADQTILDWSSAGTNILTIAATGGVVIGNSLTCNGGSNSFASGSTTTFNNTAVITQGTTPSTTGEFRVKQNWSLKGRNSTNTADVPLIDWGATAANQYIIGDQTNTSAMRIRGANVLIEPTNLSCTIGTGGIAINATSGTGSNSVITWSSGTTNVPVISQTAAATATAGTAMTLRAQAGGTSGNQNGGPLLLQGGARSGTGLKGAVRIQINGTTETFMEVVEIAAGRRVTAFNLAADLTTTEMPANTGDKVSFIANAATAPTADPANGVIEYATGGAWGLRAVGGRIETAFTTAATATAGAGALPATPEEFLVVTVNGNARKIPMYLT